MIRARFYMAMAGEPVATLDINKSVTIGALLKRLGVPEEFKEYGVIEIDGVVIDPMRWQHHRVAMPRRGTRTVDLVLVPQSKKTLALVASLAAVVATGFIAGGGLASLGFGSAFAKGAIGAYAAAAGVSLGSSLLIGALTAPPKQAAAEEGKTLAEAGIDGGNMVARDGVLPVVIGKVGISPPFIDRPRSYRLNGNKYVEAVFGVQGVCSIDNLLVNGKPAADIPGLEYELKTGAAGEAARTIAATTQIEQSEQVTLSNFQTETVASTWVNLLDQVTPENSASKAHPFKTNGAADRIRISLLAPQGLATVESTYDVGIAVRIELRKVGDTSWRRLPVLHVFDRTRGISPVQATVDLLFGTSPGDGIQVVSAQNEYPIFEATAITGEGQAFEWLSDSYFRETGYSTATSILPVMTAATTSGVTITDSSNFGSGYEGWRAADNSSASYYWRPANNSLPGWIKIALPAARTVRSYDVFISGGKEYSVQEWMLQGSNDGLAWTDLHSARQKGTLAANGSINACQVGRPGSYTFYRLQVFANGGAASGDVRIAHIRLFEVDAVGVMLSSGGVAGSVSHGGRCAHTALTRDGAVIHLDSASWPKGQYEVKIRRSWAFYAGYLNVTNASYYSYSSNSSDSDFFDYRLRDGAYKVYESPQKFRGDLVVENFATMESVAPFNPEGIAQIALRVPNMQVSSVYAEFTRHAPIVIDGAWTTALYPTKNPAALYRQILMGGANASPPPGEIIMHDELREWYQRCEAMGYEANAICSDMSVGDALQMIATCGYARPRVAHVATVVEDRDTRAEPITQIISPLNSRALAVRNEIPDLPDAVRAEYADETDRYATKQVVVYRDGMTAETAHLYETIDYKGFTSESKTAARAAFDLRQPVARRMVYSHEVGLEGYGIYVGQVVGRSSDTLNRKHGFALTREVVRVGGNVVSIRLSERVGWAAASGGVAGQAGIAIRLENGDVLLKRVNNTTDDTVADFTEPFNDGGALESDLLAVIGEYGSAGESITRRCRVISWVPISPDTFRVGLVDEAAAELFTP